YPRPSRAPGSALALSSCWGRHRCQSTISSACRAAHPRWCAWCCSSSSSPAGSSATAGRWCRWCEPQPAICPLLPLLLTAAVDIVNSASKANRELSCRLKFDEECHLATFSLRCKNSASRVAPLLPPVTPPEALRTPSARPRRFDREG